MEKKLGLHKAFSQMSEKQKQEIRDRRRETGVQIHLRNLQEYENAAIQSESERYAKELQGWIESGKTAEEAEAIMSRNREVNEKRSEKKAKKLAEK